MKITIIVSRYELIRQQLYDVVDLIVDGIELHDAKQELIFHALIDIVFPHCTVSNISRTVFECGYLLRIN